MPLNFEIITMLCLQLKKQLQSPYMCHLADYMDFTMDNPKEDKFNDANQNFLYQ